MRRTNKSRPKAKLLATTGCVVVGLGLYSFPILTGEGDGGDGKKWYKSISQVDQADPLQVAGVDRDQTRTEQSAAAVSDRTTGTPDSELAAQPVKSAARIAPQDPAVSEAMYEETEQPPAHATEPAPKAVSAAPPKPIITAPESGRIRLASLDATGPAIASKLIESSTLWLSDTLEAYRTAAPKSRTSTAPAVKVNTDPVETVSKRPAERIDPREVVHIIPASGHDLAGKDAEAAEPEEDRKWYSSFWPLGTRVGVNKLRHDYIPFQTEKADEKAAKKGLNKLPNRPNLLVELGDGFLDTGNLHPGFEVPVIGAVWQPRLWTYFINRTTIQSFDNGFSGNERETEIANRLDLFFNLQLTGTEKILLGLRPTDKNRPSDFTKYTIDGSEEGFNPDFRIGLETLFFEGDVGSLFPVLDNAGLLPVDFGFTVGRQPLIFQEGILINDTIDAFGLIRNNIVFPGTSNFRVSGIWGWNRTDRNDGTGGDEQLFGLFTAADTHLSTWNLDLIYIYDPDKSGDGIYGGLSAIQRLPHLGGISTAFRVNASYAPDGEVPGNVVGDGVLFTTELSKTVKGSDDIVYFNSFLNIGNFTQAGREPVNGGPLANTGILFASPNLSTYLAEIDPFTSDDVVGGALGYQAFWDDKRRNLILEVAGRKDLSGDGFDSLGYGFQLQQAVGQHVQLQFEAFYTHNEDNDDGSGARAEILFVL